MWRLLGRVGVAAAMVTLAGAAGAAPPARFSEVSYRSLEPAAPTGGTYRNPVLPGFHPDPSVVKVGGDFYLVTSTFGWFPGLPVFHSRDLVHWNLIGHAIDRPGMVDLSGIGIVADGLYAPAIAWHDGLFYILNTCVRCGGNFYVTAKDPAGPWSDPVWLDFEGIDPSFFFDDDGTAWIVNNGNPPEAPKYDGHRAIWIQQFDLATGKLFGPRKVLVDGGVKPEDQPIWAEGPHLYKVDGWYYLMAAEGGTADQHSQTIYRSRKPDGPYEPGPFNPILTQRDLPRDRPYRVEAPGHADLVQLDDGSWWGTFLATRPFAGQETLLGRETWLLPVRWVDGWPRFLEHGEAVPFGVPRPNLPAFAGTDWSQWTEQFDSAALSGEWLTMRGPDDKGWWKLDGGDLVLVAGSDTVGSTGQPHAVMRRMRSPRASWTTTFSFEPQQRGDSAGLLVFAHEEHFVTIGLSDEGDGPEMVMRHRSTASDGPMGRIVFRYPLEAIPEAIELTIEIRDGRIGAQWRTAGEQRWMLLGIDHDISDLASVHSGLFTGVTVGPYAVSGGD